MYLGSKLLEVKIYLALYLQTFIALRSEDTLTGEVYETIILLSQEVLWQYRQI